MKTVIKGGRVIDPASSIDKKADVVFKSDRIIEIAGPKTEYPRSMNVIDAAGCIVMPGLIDLHTHLREPGFEQKETIATGCMAAVSGGFTSICCMANTNPVNDNISVTGLILDKALAAKTARVFPIACMTVEMNGDHLVEMGELRQAGVVAFSDDGKSIMSSAIMRNALVYAKMFGAPIAVHEIDLEIAGKGAMHKGFHSVKLGLPGVPSAAEDIMIARDAILAKDTGGRVHFLHVTTKGAIDIIRDYKSKGVSITAEVTPHHFTLIDEDVGDYNTQYKMSPPLRGPSDREALINGLKDGTIDAIATDHAPHEILAKDCEFENAANGIIGLETALALTWNLVRRKQLTPRRAVELLTWGPAKCYNLPTGTISPGSLADLTIFDPKVKYIFDADRIYSKSKNSPFIGAKMQGQVKTTIVGGKTVFSRN